MLPRLSSMLSPPPSLVHIPLFVPGDSSSSAYLLHFLLSFAHIGTLVLASSLFPPCYLISPSHSTHRAEATHLCYSTHHRTFGFSILLYCIQRLSGHWIG